MSDDARLVPVMQFCCHCHCGCPEVFLAPDAPEDRRVVLTDDFGQRIEISRDQLHTLLEHGRNGALETALDAAAGR